MQIDLNQYDLIIFGDYGVLTNTPFRDHAPLAMLPGHAEYLAWLRRDRQERGLPIQYAVAGNKGGVAWAKHTEDQGREELRQTAEWIGTQLYAVCFACPTHAPGLERYSTPEMLAYRKPQPMMFKELAERASVPLEKTLIVDHYVDGYRAAKMLGCGWQSPSSFFAGVAQYIPVSPEEIARELAQLSPDAGLPEEVPLAESLDLFDIDAELDAMEEH